MVLTSYFYLRKWKIHLRYLKDKQLRRNRVMRSFQEGLKICCQDDVTVEEVIAKLRSEVLHSFSFYSEFSPNEVNVLTELDNFSVEESIEIL